MHWQVSLLFFLQLCWFFWCVWSAKTRRKSRRITCGGRPRKCKMSVPKFSATSTWRHILNLELPRFRKVLPQLKLTDLFWPINTTCVFSIEVMPSHYLSTCLCIYLLHRDPQSIEFKPWMTLLLLLKGIWKLEVHLKYSFINRSESKVEQFSFPLNLFSCICLRS